MSDGVFSILGSCSATRRNYKETKTIVFLRRVSESMGRNTEKIQKHFEEESRVLYFSTCPSTG
jgi:hypothetical protein